MAGEEKYFLGPNLAKKVVKAITRLDSESLNQEGTSGRAPVVRTTDARDPFRLCKTTAAWAKGTSQALAVYEGEPGGESEASGSSVTAWNKFSDVESDTWVAVARINGSYYLIAVEC